ncbi:hypothetical protein [Vitiosangium sp. GDMCC 1.1324]|uniref:hypothetical protein n=1 Tax=Vitiosangium sp. (strain GDMCC 1.1324) TaxID=2138576 RepID=UPI000D3863BC|nr:hypothetical protein [Vitiosangium sp. GDMCC 1.1324]PTL85673.1 hypothetical protein DAT35_02880 [Vitiosangium sp. GDMCC 1.1324]
MRSLLLLALLMGTGCASTLSSMQTAKPLARGQFQVSGAMGVFVPASQIVTLVDEGIQQGKAIKKSIDNDQRYELSEQDAQRLLGVGMALAVAPPGTANELMVRAGLLESNRLDAGLRLSSTSVRLDTKLRLAHGGDPDDSLLPDYRRHSYDLAIGVGVARHIFNSYVLDALEIVKIDEFSRWDVEVPVYLSMDLGDIFKVYAAPKYIFSHTSLDAKLVDYSLAGKDVSGFDLTLPASVSSHFYGASMGLALGYKYVHVYAEITAGYSYCRPVIFGQQRDLGGVTLYPSIGIAIKNPLPLGTGGFRPDSPVSPESPVSIP